MNQEIKPENTGSMGPMLLTFLAGTAVGAIVVALTTPKSGPELRSDLKAMAIRSKQKAGAMAEDASGVWDEVKERTCLAGSDLKRGVTDAADDLCGKRHEHEMAEHPKG